MDSLVDADRQVICGWGVVLVKGRRDALREIGSYELGNVLLLLQYDAIGIRSDVDVEEVGDSSFVFDIPS
eukprot:581589-Pleurochrysis_carterae.AAC.2